MNAIDFMNLPNVVAIIFEDDESKDLGILIPEEGFALDKFLHIAIQLAEVMNFFNFI